MRTRWLGFLLFLFTAVLAAKITTDYDHSANFSKYKTYSWLEVKTDDPFWPDRIRNAVDAQLTARGWKKVPSGGNASVVAFGSTYMQPRVETFYQDYGWHG